MSSHDSTLTKRKRKFSVPKELDMVDQNVKTRLIFDLAVKLWKMGKTVKDETAVLELMKATKCTIPIAGISRRIRKWETTNRLPRHLPIDGIRVPWSDVPLIKSVDTGDFADSFDSLLEENDNKPQLTSGIKKAKINNESKTVALGLGQVDLLDPQTVQKLFASDSKHVDCLATILRLNLEITKHEKKLAQLVELRRREYNKMEAMKQARQGQLDEVADKLSKSGNGAKPLTLVTTVTHSIPVGNKTASMDKKTHTDKKTNAGDTVDKLDKPKPTPNKPSAGVATGKSKK